MHTLSLPSGVRIEDGPGGFRRLEVATPQASASIYLYGAQVASYTPAGAEPLLFFSEKSYYTSGKPMRGGAPVIFPWFGAHPSDSAKPAHGFARTREWTLEAATENSDGSIRITLRLDPDADAARWWPEAQNRWTLRHHITIGQALTMALEVENLGDTAITFEDALHTYFAIRDIREVSIRGLENTDYLTIIEDQPRKNQGPAPIHFDRETDRVYLSTASPIQICEPHRTLTLHKEGAASVVVWNPWTEKASQLQDMGDHEWPHMVCVETGNAKDNQITLAPGSTHRSTTTLSLTPA